MAWTWTPDFFGGGGNFGPPPNRSLTLEDLLTGERYLKDLRQKFEDEEKKKKERKKPEAPKFTFMELWGAVMLLSIPVTLGQMYLIQMAQSKLAEIATTLAHP